MRMLFEFGKKRRLRYISHLDLQRFMQRALRRTGLPVKYSQGFNPHAQMAFASALAMGQESRCELLDVKLDAPVSEQEAFERMAAALPPDMPLLRVRQVQDTHPSLMAILMAADYEIALSGPGAAETARAVEVFLSKDEYIALRRTKSGEKPTDIRPLALELSGEEGEGESALIRARLMLTERATLRPELLIGELAKLAHFTEPPACEISRVGLLATQNDALIDLIDFDRAF